MKRTLQTLWFSIVIIAVAIPLGGCQDGNEGEVAGTTGTSNPKYDKGDDAAYRAYAQDANKNKPAGKAGKSASK
jgi:hypothetical protein